MPQVACDLRFREAIALCLQRRELAEQPADGLAFATADRDEVLRFLAEKARRLFEGALRDHGRIGVVDRPDRLGAVPDDRSDLPEPLRRGASTVRRADRRARGRRRHPGTRRRGRRTRPLRETSGA